MEGKEKRRIVGRNVAVGFASAIIVLLAVLGGLVAYYNSVILSLNKQISTKDAEISQLQTWLQGNITSYENQINMLNDQLNEKEYEISSLNSQLNTLQSNYNSLQSSYNLLNSCYQSLQESYEQLYADYQSLQASYEQLNASYQYIKETYREVSNDIFSLNDFFISLTQLPDAFSRTLNEEAVNAVASAVADAGVSAEDVWSSFQSIYNWITSHINYAYDVKEPYLLISWWESSGERFVTNLDFITFREYIQTPELTLELSQGDCEDQAILAYAMIKYYMRNIHGTEYSLYLADITFYSGAGHAAVFLPVQGGKLCIIDPAGHYLTKTWWGKITANTALDELQAYSDYWLSQEGGIKHIKLYNVDVTDGSYTVVAEGNIMEIAIALS